MLNITTGEVEPNQNYPLDLSAKELEIKIIKDGESLELIRELADSHYREGNYLRALVCYTKLLSFEPGNARVWNKIAVIFIRLNEPTSAIALSRIAHRLITKEMTE